MLNIILPTIVNITATRISFTALAALRDVYIYKSPQWEHYSQGSLCLSSPAGVPMNFWGMCNSHCIAFAVYNQEHSAEYNNNFIVDLKDKIKHSEKNKKFFEFLLHSQIIYDSSFYVKQQGSIADLANISIPSYLRDEAELPLLHKNGRTMGIMLSNNGSNPHALAAKIIQTPGQETVYDLFDPNYGIKHRLSESQLKRELTKLAGSYGYNSFHFNDLILEYNTKKNSPMISQYADAKKLDFILKNKYIEDINILLPSGKTLLTETIFFSTNYNKLKTFLNKGANPNIMDAHGNIPIHIAVDYDWILETDLLLQHKADPNILNSKMQSPLELAINKQSIRMISLLLSYGADINLTSKANDGITLYELAKRTNNNEIIKLFETKPSRPFLRIKYLAALEAVMPVVDFIKDLGDPWVNLTSILLPAIQAIGNYYIANNLSSLRSIGYFIEANPLIARTLIGSFYLNSTETIILGCALTFLCTQIMLSSEIYCAVDYIFTSILYGCNNFTKATINCAYSVCTSILYGCNNFTKATINCASDVGTSILSALKGRSEEVQEISRG